MSLRFFRISCASFNCAFSRRKRAFSAVRSARVRKQTRCLCVGTPRRVRFPALQHPLPFGKQLRVDPQLRPDLAALSAIALPWLDGFYFELSRKFLFCILHSEYSWILSILLGCVHSFDGRSLGSFRLWRREAPSHRICSRHRQQPCRCLVRPLIYPISAMKMGG
jgi:hypothetical protein